MRLLSPVIFLTCFICGNGNQDQWPTNVLDITTPKDFGNYINERLAHTDARFISRKCFGQLIEFAKGLLLGPQLWPIQMFDANAKIPSGLLRGHGGALGTFDQCLKVKADNTSLGTIRGKYCLGGIRILNLTSFEGLDLGLRQTRLINLVDRNVYIPWGACFPDACSAKDLRLLHLFILTFSDESCQTEESQTSELDNSDIGALAFLGVIAALMVISTTYDVIVYYLGKGPGNAILRSFSVYTNVQKIVTIKENDDELLCLHGIRACSILLLMFGLRFLMYALLPLSNWIDLFMWLADKNKSVIMEGLIAADTFFVLSGMLVAYNYLKATEGGGCFNFILYYLNRIISVFIGLLMLYSMMHCLKCRYLTSCIYFIQKLTMVSSKSKTILCFGTLKYANIIPYALLTPALAAMILIHATLIRHLGSGPVWPTARDTLLVNSCREKWWSSLLYVQNYVNPGLTTVCLIQTWQLSVDMQLFILSPLILIPLRKTPRFTFSIVTGLLVCATASPFLVTWIYQLKAVIATNRSLKDIENYIVHFFFPLHTRAAPWLIGFITGYIVYEIKTNKPKLSMHKGFLRFMACCFWAIAGGLMALCIFIGRELIYKEYNWLGHAFHLALMRPAWSIAISWIIIACVSGYGGPVNWLLSAPMFQVVSRVSYCTFLVNISVMLFVSLQTRVGVEFGEFDAVYRYWGDIAFSLAIGFVCTLAFESPMITIGKAIFGGFKGTKREYSKNDSAVEG